MLKTKASTRAHQSLSAAVLWRLALLFSVAGAGLLWTANSVMQGRLDAFDASQYASDAKQVAKVIETDNESLLASVQDYAKWDQTYAYAAKPDPAFIEANFNDESLTNLRSDVQGIFDPHGRLLHSNMLMEKGKYGAINAELLATVTQRLQDPVGTAGRMEMLQANNRPAVLAIFLITDNKGTKPANGAMFFLRYLDGPYQARTAALTGTVYSLSTTAPSAATPAQESTEQQWLATRAVGGGGMFVSVGGPTQLAQQREYIFWTRVVTAIGFSLVSLLGVAFILRSQLLVRLSAFSDLADQARNDLRDADSVIRWPVKGDDELDNLARSLNEMWAQLQDHKDEMAQLAFHDSLTSLPNRRLMQERLPRAIANNARHQTRAALILIDLDNFKSLNDTRGHEEGDACLVEVAVRLRSAIRGVDTAARLGGDEFTVMLEGLSHALEEAAAQATGVSQKICEALAQPMHLPLGIHKCSASMGVTIFDGSSATLKDLLKQADQAMYQAKRDGRNCWRFFDPSLQQVALDHDND